MVKEAWIISVNMGYGHQRAAYPFKEMAHERIITANSDKIITPKEQKMWRHSRLFYEGISRMMGVPLIGNLAFNLYDHLQRISPLYPFRDLSKPSLEVAFIHRLIKRGLCKSIIEYVKKRDIPFITTFFIPALSASYHGLKNIYCIVTDSDINRAWVPKNPKKSTINYLVPCEKVIKRLKEYGIPENKIFLTGFPLPKENLGKNLEILKKDLANRLPNLDPKKKHLSRYKGMIEKTLGTKIKSKSAHPLTISYCIGGAGAGVEIVEDILKGLKNKLAKRQIHLNLVAGIRLEVMEYLEKQVIRQGLSKQLGKNIHIIYALTKKEYFEKFNKMLHTTDILWTKPSELIFFCGLGIPIIIAPHIGAHEVYNEEWLLHIGGGIKQKNPKYASEWIEDFLNSGRLAEAAWEGFLKAPNKGVYEIEKIIFKGNITEK